MESGVSGWKRVVTYIIALAMLSGIAYGVHDILNKIHAEKINIESTDR